VPCATLQTGGETREKTAPEQMGGALLHGALTALAGYGAAAALSAGPDGGLSAVAKRPYKRRLEKVRAHAPRPADRTALLWRFTTAWAERPVARKGSTTEGAALSPDPSREGCGEGPHQLWTFPILKALPPGVGRAVAAERARVAKSQPQWQRGRPSSTEQAARRVARQSTSMPQTISDLFPDRLLWVKRRLPPAERQRLLPIPRGLPPLRKLREMLAHSAAWFDRCCHTSTVLGKRKQRRQGVHRCTWRGETVNKGCAPHREKALPFLEDQRLPAPSKAVERGHRRHRTRQKSGYRVRSQVGGEGRMALDMSRASRAEGRSQTTQALHQARRGST
jgi:hypothetical protein